MGCLSQWCIVTSFTDNTAMDQLLLIVVIHCLFTLFWSVTFGWRKRSCRVQWNPQRKKDPQMPTPRLWRYSLSPNARNTECRSVHTAVRARERCNSCYGQHVTRIDGPECFALFSQPNNPTLAIIAPQQGFEGSRGGKNQSCTVDTCCGTPRRPAEFILYSLWSHLLDYKTL